MVAMRTGALDILSNMEAENLALARVAREAGDTLAEIRYRDRVKALKRAQDAIVEDILSKVTLHFD